MAHWFALAVALAFCSGFLIIFTFMDRFGIRDSGAEFFRIKYIHVGILFLLFPLSILFPFVAIIDLKHAARKARDKKWPADMEPLSEAEIAALNFPYSGVASFLNMCGLFYVFLLFTPRQVALSNQDVIFLVPLVSLLAPPLVEWFVNKFIQPQWSEIFSRHCRWLILIATIIVLDYSALHGLYRPLWHMFWGPTSLPSGGIYYFFFMLLIPYVFWRTNSRARKISSPRLKKEMRFTAFALSMMIYFLAIVSFSLRVYPFIPAAKGGGDYTESPTVRLTFRPIPLVDAALYPEDEIHDDLSKRSAYVLIEQTPEALYLANAAPGLPPERWRDMRELPTLVEVRRDAIDRVVYSPAVRNEH